MTCTRPLNGIGNEVLWTISDCLVVGAARSWCAHNALNEPLAMKCRIFTSYTCVILLLLLLNTILLLVLPTSCHYVCIRVWLFEFSLLSAQSSSTFGYRLIFDCRSGPMTTILIVIDIDQKERNTQKKNHFDKSRYISDSIDYSNSSTSMMTYSPLFNQFSCTNHAQSSSLFVLCAHTRTHTHMFSFELDSFLVLKHICRWLLNLTMSSFQIHHAAHILTHI